MVRSRLRETILTSPVGEGDTRPPFRYTFRAMAAVHELILWTDERRRANRVARAAIADVLRIEAKFSRYRDDSVTTSINRAAGLAQVAIDGETAALLRYADRCHRLSNGAFDISSGVLRRAWDFRRRPPLVPTSDEIAAALAHVGWDRVEWNDAHVRLPNPGMELDFGGIGKEYAADRAATICADHGVAAGVVNLGGDVRVIGPRPDGAPWRVGISHPRVDAAVIGTVEVRDGAVATSGDYERYFELDGRRYCHLLDSRTGWPVDHWQSATVVAPLAILAGSYATIAMLLGADAPAFLAQHRVTHLLVRADGTVVTASPSSARDAQVVVA